MAWSAELIGLLIKEAGLIGALLAAFLIAGIAAAHFKLITKFPRWASVTLALLFVLFIFVALFKDTLERVLFRTQTVDVILRTEDGALVDTVFKLKVRITDHGVKDFEGREGVAAVRGIPTAEPNLDIISVDANGWRMSAPGKDHPITSGVVKVIMAKQGLVPPVDDTQRPDPSVFAPAKDKLLIKPSVPPEQVTLHYANRTRDSLVLVMCPYSASESTDQWSPKAKWIDFPISSQPDFYDKFKDGTGWYGIWVRDGKNTHWPLGAHNLFIAEQVWLTIEDATDDAKGPYGISVSTEEPVVP